MTAIRLSGHITHDGKLECDLPAGLPAGEVEVVIELPDSLELAPGDQTWIEAELDALLQHEPRTAVEIAASDAVGSWKHLNITDSAAWVEQVRRKEQEHHAW
jgi:hypothetical protein